jgi:rSAM/selenodomain-associated transferase 2
MMDGGSFLKCSIIIPTLNEEKTIVQLINSLHDQKAGYELEVIVVDGGSKDQTVTLAHQLATKVIESKPGRAEQMNAAAEVASGEILLFLHSDSRLESGALSELREIMSDKQVVGGCFRLAFMDSNWLLKWIAWGSHIRAKRGKVMFGDQGIFVRKSVFDKVGGFPFIQLMEDWELSRRVRVQGIVRCGKKKIFTSSRRFRHKGILKTFILMQKLKWMYIMGRSPAHLRKYYEDHR